MADLISDAPETTLAVLAKLGASKEQALVSAANFFS